MTAAPGLRHRPLLTPDTTAMRTRWGGVLSINEASAPDEIRPEIASAWRRAAAAGLDPGMGVCEPPVADVDRSSRLAQAACPVLDRMLEDLVSTRFSVLLANRTARIIDRRLGQRGLDRALDRVLAVPGSQYVEEFTGTNSLATAFELQRPIAVTGGEHFLEALKGFCCYGAPIVHPVTRRLEGVLDISGPVGDATPLLGPFLMRAVRDIEQRLLEGARVSEQRLLAEFQTRSRNNGHAVLVFGDNLVLSNQGATDVIDNIDYASLRGIAGELLGSEAIHRQLTLTSGAQVLVQASAVPECPGGVLFEIVPVEGKDREARRPLKKARAQVRALSVVKDEPLTSRVVLVVGEPGSGRTTTGKALSGTDAVTVDAADANGDDDLWLSATVDALFGTDSVLIDNIHALAPRMAARLAPAVRGTTALVVLTSSPLSGLDVEQSALAAEAMDRRELRPVRNYQQDFAALTTSVLRQLSPGSNLRIAASAVQLLANQPWPGNLRQLRAVLEYAVRGRSQAVITVADLPEEFRGAPTRRLLLMETAERDAIVQALRAAGGNRVAAATQLGIGRTTLYDRLRRYDITV